MHTQFSWDAPRGDMEATCRKALQIGLPAIAFTEHADFTGGGYPDFHRLDMAAYREEVERCRRLFPDLRILSGVELGQPHLFAADAAAVLASGPLDRVLGSVHCVPWQGELTDVSTAEMLAPERAAATLDTYLRELLALVESSQPFEVLAHLDYPKRYWPHDRVPYEEEEYEEPIRAVLRAAAARGSVLELNTTRGAEPRRGLCPGPKVLRWWVEEGGGAVSMGSDAHDPARIAMGFELACQLAEAAGFRPNDDPAGYWLR
ncbi:MAG TPA: histidinol-phosphatase HisJ family protein [Candidatus Dormibacteraeota bacterium]|nr:histidinol-phosphatase HisJ family protein [Candidatus Dormibacteraeota bacterium]